MPLEDWCEQLDEVGKDLLRSEAPKVEEPQWPLCGWRVRERAKDRSVDAIGNDRHALAKATSGELFLQAPRSAGNQRAVAVEPGNIPLDKRHQACVDAATKGAIGRCIGTQE